MANMFSLLRAERTKLRKLPLLPRFGFTVEIAGRQLSYKQVPLLETILNLRERGFSLKNFKKVSNEELDEVRFPGRPGQNLAPVKDLHPKAAKKSPVKAAAKRRTEKGGDTASV